MASEAAASHQQAGHMTAIAKEPSHQKALAKGPSTYGRGCAAGASADEQGAVFGSSGAVLEAPALVAGLDDVAVVSETIEKRGGHLRVAEDARPFAEGEIGGDDD